MAYPKANVERVLAADPEITVLELATRAAEDHTRESGCSFPPDAGRLAVEALGLTQDVAAGTRASLLSSESSERLSRALEALEIDCPHRKPQGGPGEAGSDTSATDGASEVTGRADGLYGLSEGT